MVVVFASHTCLCPNFTTLVARTAAVWLPPCATHWHGKEAAMTSPRGLIKVIGHRKSWDKLMDELHTCFKLMQVCTLAARDTSYRSKHKKTKEWQGVQPTHSSLCGVYHLWHNHVSFNDFIKGTNNFQIFTEKTAAAAVSPNFPPPVGRHRFILPQVWYWSKIKQEVMKQHYSPKNPMSNHQA